MGTQTGKGIGERNIHSLEVKENFPITYQALFKHFLARSVILQLPCVHIKNTLISTHQPDLPAT